MSDSSIGSYTFRPGGFLPTRPTGPRAAPPDSGALPGDQVSLSRPAPGEPTWAATLGQALQPQLEKAAVNTVARNMATLTWDWVLQAVPEAQEGEEKAGEALLALLRGLAPEVEGHSDRVGRRAEDIMRDLCNERGLEEPPDGYMAGAARYRNVGMLAVELSCLDDEEREALAGEARESFRRAGLAGRLHDLGKLAIPRSILSKPGPLTAVERRIVELHPLVGERMLQQVPGLAEYRDAVRWHHERWDGGGYPDGLVEDSIPLVARVMCAADCYDAMTEERPYRQRLTPAGALQEILRGSGTQFDPRVVGVFARLLVQEMG